MKKQRKFEENIKVTAINPPKSCLRCMFFGTDIDEPNGMCLLAGREIDLDTADKGIMADCKIKRRKQKKGKATKGEIRTNFDACCENIENMAAVLDIAKIGWTKEQLVKWLKEANNTEFQEAEHDQKDILEIKRMTKVRKIVEKKILPKYFDAVICGKKKFEIRKDEDDVQIGDAVILKEWDGEKYTGREVGRNIVYILRDVPEYGLMPGYVIFGW